MQTVVRVTSGKQNMASSENTLFHQIQILQDISEDQRATGWLSLCPHSLPTATTTHEVDSLSEALDYLANAAVLNKMTLAKLINDINLLLMQNKALILKNKALIFRMDSSSTPLPRWVEQKCSTWSHPTKGTTRSQALNLVGPSRTTRNDVQGMV